MPSRACDCSIIIPTRNREAILADTLARLTALGDCAFEVIVCDNGSSDETLGLQTAFPEVRWIALRDNHGCAARNIGAAAAHGRLLLMLDDDSWPAEGVITSLVQLFDSRLDLGAAALRVRLADPPHRHDAGGVAGVFFNCGGAIRRTAYLEAGGFPINYDYYAEEYDLCCRLWRAGWQIEPQGCLEVTHRRVARNRDNDNMLRLLVRNNLRLWGRYAPSELREDIIESTIERYYRLAVKEKALEGYNAGLREGRAIVASARVFTRPLTIEQFESLMGVDVAREKIARWADKHRAQSVGVWTRGKGAELLIDLLEEAGISIAAVYDSVDRPNVWRGCALRSVKEFDPATVDGLVVGSLSCGVAEDAHDSLILEYPGLPIVSPACYGRSAERLTAIPA